MHFVVLFLLFASVYHAANFTSFPTGSPTYYDPPKPPSPIWGILTAAFVFFCVVGIGLFSFALFWYFDPELRQNLSLSSMFRRKEENYQKLSTGDGPVDGDDSSSDHKFNLSDFDEEEGEAGLADTTALEEDVSFSSDSS